MSRPQILDMKSFRFLNFLFIISFLSCGGVDLIDDYVPPSLRITTPFTELTLGNSYTFTARYFDNVGDAVENASIQWESSHPELLQIDAQGNATPLKVGTVQIVATLTTPDGIVLTDEINLSIQSNVVLEPTPPETPVEEEMEMPVEEEMPMENAVTPTLSITNAISQITAATSYQFEVAYTDEMGNPATPPQVTWTSSNNDIIEVDANGTIQAIMSGTVTLTVSIQISSTLIQAHNQILVNAPVMEMITSFSGKVVSKSSYTLQGGFTLAESEKGLILSLDEDYKASTALPGLYVYLSNNANTTAGAYEIGKVTVFAGAHSYQLPNSIELMDYQYILYWCKPFNVKVGEAKIYD